MWYFLGRGRVERGLQLVVVGRWYYHVGSFVLVGFLVLSANRSDTRDRQQSVSGHPRGAERLPLSQSLIRTDGLYHHLWRDHVHAAGQIIHSVHAQASRFVLYVPVSERNTPQTPAA